MRRVGGEEGSVASQRNGSGCGRAREGEDTRPRAVAEVAHWAVDRRVWLE